MHLVTARENLSLIQAGSNGVSIASLSGDIPEICEIFVTASGYSPPTYRVFWVTEDDGAGWETSENTDLFSCIREFLDGVGSSRAAEGVVPENTLKMVTKIATASEPETYMSSVAAIFANSRQGYRR